MEKFTSRHIVIGIAVLIAMFVLRFKGIVVESELTMWYDTIKWLVGIVVFGHAANKFVDGRAK